jgi:2,3-bisphosphoglycerate-dependent phosphoglycerate mutase
MKTDVYFVRHAQPDFSVKDDKIRPLSEKGMEDTKKVTYTLIDKNIISIYSSPFKRSIDTIKDFAESTGLEIKIENDFRERKVGEWVEDFRAFSQKQWEDFNFRLDNGETLREVQERNISALFKVINNNLGKSVAIATHGTALSTIINYFNPSFGYTDFWNIVDKMPYILHFRFNGMELEYIKKIEIK